MPYFTRIIGPFHGQQVKKSKVYGYCRFHGIDLTFKQSKRMKCLAKGCKRLVPNMEHPEWKKKGVIIGESSKTQSAQ